MKHPHPITTTDVVKVLREQGLAVEYSVDRDDRQAISLNAAEHWLPALVFGYEVATNVSADLIVAVIMQLFGKVNLSSDRLHVRFGNSTADGTVEFFEAHGRGEDVVKAIRAHGKARR